MARNKKAGKSRYSGFEDRHQRGFVVGARRAPRHGRRQSCTTTAPTIIRAGTKDNVLPQRARAVVNHRIMPGETIGSVLNHDREIIEDERVIVRALPGGHNPGTPASTDSPDFQRLREVIRARSPSMSG